MLEILGPDNDPYLSRTDDEGNLLTPTEERFRYSDAVQARINARQSLGGAQFEDGFQMPAEHMAPSEAAENLGLTEPERSRQSSGQQQAFEQLSLDGAPEPTPPELANRAGITEARRLLAAQAERAAEQELAMAETRRLEMVSRGILADGQTVTEAHELVFRRQKGAESRARLRL